MAEIMQVPRDRKPYDRTSQSAQRFKMTDAKLAELHAEGIAGELAYSHEYERQSGRALSAPADIARLCTPDMIEATLTMLADSNWCPRVSDIREAAQSVAAASWMKHQVESYSRAAEQHGLPPVLARNYCGRGAVHAACRWWVEERSKTLPPATPHPKKQISDSLTLTDAGRLRWRVWDCEYEMPLSVATAAMEERSSAWADKDDAANRVMGEMVQWMLAAPPADWPRARDGGLRKAEYRRIAKMQYQGSLCPAEVLRELSTQLLNAGWRRAEPDYMRNERFGGWPLERPER